MLVEASNLTQTMLSWVSGCAVIDWVCAALPVFYSDPLPANMAAIGGLTVLFTILCIVWLIASGERSARRLGDYCRPLIRSRSWVDR